jgi:hypothetical protein
MSDLRLLIPREFFPHDQDLDFTPSPGTFALQRPSLQAWIHLRVRGLKRKWLSRLLFKGWREQYRQLVDLENHLQTYQDEPEAALDEDLLHVLCHEVAELIYKRQFEYARCPACKIDYPPKEGQIMEWLSGEGLAAAGGKRFVCPRGHTLYARMDWLS